MESTQERTDCLKSLVEHYFRRGHRYKIIVFYLQRDHNIKVTIRTVKRILQGQGLKRNGISRQLTDPVFQTTVSSIQHTTENRAGYRRTWHILNFRYRIRSTQERVRLYLHQIDPIAVANRVRRLLVRRRYYSPGPNHVWHFDGYDKLKPYGFAIHGCSDGYSRKILWLKCSVTNNDPAVILHHFLTTVKKCGGCPTILRSDCGTETGLAAAAQCTLRNDSRAHVYGPSYRNQRIESWWSKLRSGWTQIWMNLFDDLVSFGAYVPSDPVHKAVAEYCFMSVIQNELDDFVRWWNTHRIRPTATSGCPGGIPLELFELPEVHGGVNYLKVTEPADVDILLTQAFCPPQCSDLVLNSLCTDLCNANAWNSPVNRNEATALCLKMLHKLVSLRIPH